MTSRRLRRERSSRKRGNRICANIRIKEESE
jgi:hypothetical protein